MAGTFGAWTDIDLQADGKRAGRVHIPYSRNRDGWGCIQIPICVISNGAGPTVFLMGGNHGDEYEGQVGLTTLYRTLNIEDVRGRILILPSANYPACLAGSRLSPLDGGNLNRVFPGNPDGTITERIAHFISAVLYPQSQWHIDVHAGGEGDEFVPVMTAFLADNEAMSRQAAEAVKLIGAPYYAAEKVPSGGEELKYASGAAVAQGLISLGGEFGGGGGLSGYGLGLVADGLRRVLRVAGVFGGTVAELDPNLKQQRIRTCHASAFCYATREGIFESFFRIGDRVHKGDVCGLLHCLDEPARQPEQILIQEDGIIISQKRARRVGPGACLAALARPVTE